MHFLSRPLLIERRRVYMKKREFLKIYKTIVYTNGKHILGLIIFAGFESVAALISPYLLMKLLDCLQESADMKPILLVASAIIVVALCNYLIQIMLTYENSILSRKIKEYYQKECMRQLFQLDGKDLTELDVGESMTLMLRDVEQIGFFVSKQFWDFVLSVISAIVILILTLSKNIGFFAICMVLIVTTVVIQSYYDKKIELNIEESRKDYSQLTDLIQSVLGKSVSCILCDCGNFFSGKHKSVMTNEAAARMKTQIIITKNIGALSLVSKLYTVVILVVGGISVINGEMSVGALLACNSYVQMLLVPVVNMPGVFSEMRSTEISLKKIKSFLELPSVADGGQCEEREIKELSLKNVSFSYSTQKVLKDVSMKFTKGITGIVGESGGGKTTITSMLDRLWSPDCGEVHIDMIEYKDVDVRWLRSQMSIVPQDAFLFEDSIWNNISLGEEIDSERMNEICQAVCIYDWIMEQKDKYETSIGDNGIKLSGGQRQRICLARALLQDRPILILDEATSALDYNTENKIWENIHKYISNKIVIVITHRVQTLTFADKIYLIKDGAVFNSGSYFELMNDTYYKSLQSEENGGIPA